MAQGEGGGAPTKYITTYDKQAYRLSLLGYTDEQLAEFFEVCKDTINEWKKVYPKFSASIKKGKQDADANVAESLYKRATGYSCEETDIKVIEGEIVKTKIRKHYPPDTAAAIIWLKNRQKAKWRDKIDHGLEGGGQDAAPIVIQSTSDIDLTKVPTQVLEALLLSQSNTGK